MRRPIGNPFVDAPKIEESDVWKLYKTLVDNKEHLESFLGNPIVKCIIPMLKERRDNLIQQLIETNPNEIGNQGWVRGQIEELDTILTFIDLK